MSTGDPSPLGRDREFTKVVLYQLAIVLTTVTQATLDSHTAHLRHLVAKYATPDLVATVFAQVLPQLSLVSPSDSAALVDHLCQDQLRLVAEDLVFFDPLVSALATFFAAHPSVSVVDFSSRYCSDPVLQFLLVVKFESTASTATVKEFVRTHLLELLNYIKSRQFPASYNWSLVLGYILNTAHFPFIHKLLTLSLLKAFKLNIDPINKFYQQILAMSFKQLLLEIGPEHLLPEKLLLLLLQIKPHEVDHLLALILLEVLVPGSQGLSGIFSRGGQALPEAAAKGAQLAACLREHDQKATVNWYAVFTHLQELLFDLLRRLVLPLALAVTTFLLAVDFKAGVLDLFLSFSWYFGPLLLCHIYTLSPQDGAYDLCRLNNLTRCFADDTVPVAAPVQFINVAKLEVAVVDRLQAHPDAEPAHAAAVTQGFEQHYHRWPEYLLVAAAATVDRSPFVAQLVERLFAAVLELALAKTAAVVAKIDQLDQPLLLATATAYVAAHPGADSAAKVAAAMLPALVDAWLDQLTPQTAMAAAVAALGSGYDYEAAIDRRTAKEVPEPERAAAYAGLLAALDARAHADYDRAQAGNHTVAPLAIPAVYAMLDKLKAAGGLLDAERLKNLQLLLLTTYPRLINYGNGHDAAILANTAPAFSPAVEQEMKAYYLKMYNKEVDIKDIVDMLVQFKNSDDPHKQDVFACMIHLLLDEYRFFSEYPLLALALTLLLFGALLEKDLIQGTTLTVALNFIWELCNQPVDLHLFKFAVQLLYNFKLRLHEYPIYCKHLLECQLLHNHAKMYQIVKDASNGIPCHAATQPPAGLTPVPPADDLLKLIGLVLLAGPPQEPPLEQVRDKLLFFVNNMTADNLKLDEIRDLLGPGTHHLWFARYLVSERAKTEPNNHEMYATLVMLMELAVLYRCVLLVTLDHIAKLVALYLELALLASQDKQHLKNLGAWLGRLTLAQDRPILRSHLAVKYLLVEAYDAKRLPVVIPFVCKILDQAQHSRVFSPPNPWVEGVLRVLAELYECADLKLNLKFEIEVLLNLFLLKIGDIAPLTLIRTHNLNPQALAAMFGLGSDLAGDLARLLMYDPVPVPQPMPQPPRVMQQMPPPPPEQYDTLFLNLVGSTIFTQHANLRRAFQALLARAVRECAVPILNRVLEAVLTTTAALVAKDFATEGDVLKVRKAYQTMAQQLTHAMVLCLGRKLLAETIEATMLQFLGTANPQELPVAELGTAIQQNVGLCVDIVAKIALENTVDLIDDRMHPQLVAREERRGEPFVAESASEYAMALPPPLGLLRDGATAAQLAIYDQFGTAAAPAKEMPPPPPPMMLPPEADEVLFETLFATITQNCDKAILLLADTPETKLIELAANHPIMAALTHALTVAQTHALKYPELLLKAAQYAVNCLFTQQHDNPMATEIYVVMLDKLCEYLPLTAKDVTWWLVHLSDQRKFNVPVMYALLKVQLVAPAKLDALIGRLVRDTASPVVVQFACALLRAVFGGRCPEDERPVALRGEFATTLAALAAYLGDDAAVAARDAVFDELRHQENPFLGADMYLQLGYVFIEWSKLLNHPEHTPALKKAFVADLVHHQVVSDPKVLATFVKLALDIAVTAFAFEHEVRARTLHELYLTVDALAALVVETTLAVDNNPLGFLSLVIAVVVHEFAALHEQAAGALPWNERAFFRFFSLLLAAWADALVYDDSVTAGIDFHGYMGEVLIGLQPVIFPGFTFAWVLLIAHRMLLPKLLESGRELYPVVVRFLTALLKFQLTYARDFNHDITLVLFKAVNRIVIGIAHDFPEFLVESHYQLALAIPHGFIQLRNIVLLAAPASVAIPDPFTQGLKVERLPEINEAPAVAYQPVEDLVKVGLKKPVETFLRIPAPALMRTIYQGLKLNHPKEGDGETVHYNTKLINALVLHVGISAVAEKLTHGRFSPKLSQVALLADLMNYGDSEFRFHAVNAIANQLRYPNAHTHWFVGIILYFFLSHLIWSSPEIRAFTQEIITRVLLERRIAAKPHPWGLTIVFTELVKNSDFGFFDLPFVKQALPDLRAIFDALAVNVKGSSPGEETL